MALPRKTISYLYRVLIIVLTLIIVFQGCARGVYALDQQFFAGNDILFYDPTSCSPSAGDASTTLVDGDNIKKAFFYFVAKGLTAVQSAGIVGNLMQESGVNPKALNPKGAEGIAQWTHDGRWDVLSKWAKGRDVHALQTQLDFMWYEMTSVSPWKLALQGSTNPAYPSLKAITGDTRDDAIRAGHSFGYLYEKFDAAGSRDRFAGEVWTKYHADAKSTNPGNDNPDTNCAGGGTPGTCQNAPAGWVQDTNKIVDIACQEWNKKVVEDSGGNCDKAGNITKYAKSVGFGSCGLAWCGMFVGYVYKTAGVPFPGSAGVAAVDSLWGYLGTVGARRSASTKPKPGDVIIYGSDHHHTGLVVGVDGKYVTSIEGNTGPDPQDKVNKSSAEGVHMHHRTYPGLQDSWGDVDVLSKKQLK